MLKGGSCKLFGEMNKDLEIKIKINTLLAQDTILTRTRAIWREFFEGLKVSRSLEIIIKIYKNYDLSFPVVNFLFLYVHIALSPSCYIYIFQLTCLFWLYTAKTSK